MRDTWCECDLYCLFCNKDIIIRNKELVKLLAMTYNIQLPSLNGGNDGNCSRSRYYYRVCPLALSKIQDTLLALSFFAI